MIGGAGSLAAVEGDYKYTGKFSMIKKTHVQTMQILRYKIIEKEAKSSLFFYL